ncbi:MAG: hypothetical protein ACRD2A_27050 [Vicinamibacterales bacterium]
MPIPEERLPQVDEFNPDASNAGLPESIAEREELQFDSVEALDQDDDVLHNDEAAASDTAGFGYGDPGE